MNREALLHLFDSAPAEDDEQRGADISSCELYRYSLWRRWDRSKPAVLFVMLNPSTADAEQDDPTIRRCIGFAQRWGAGGVRVCNLYAYRTAYPKVLREAAGAGIDPVGLLTGMQNKNDLAIASMACDAGRIIAAWGAWPGPYPMRVWRVNEILRRYGDVEALALTKDGSPRHPLYVRGDVEPVVYQASERAA